MEKYYETIYYNGKEIGDADEPKFICKDCGAQVKENDNYCTQCGRKLKGENIKE